MTGSKPKTSNRLQEALEKCKEKYSSVLEGVSSSGLGKHVMKISNETGIATGTLIQLPYSFVWGTFEKRGTAFEKLLNGVKEAVANKLMLVIAQKIGSLAFGTIVVGLSRETLKNAVFKAVLSGGIGFVVDMVLDFVRIHSNDDIKEKKTAIKKSLWKNGGWLVGSIIGSALPGIGSWIGGIIGCGIGWALGKLF